MIRALNLRKVAKNVVIIIIFAILFVFVFNPKKYISISFEGFKIYACTVLPALFPFFTFTTILTKLINFNASYKQYSFCKTLFNLPPISLYAFFTNILSGYPVGINITKELYSAKYLTKNQAISTSIMSSTSGPIFTIGIVGGIMFNNIIYGIIIYVSNILAVITSAIILRPKDKIFDKNIKIINNNSNILYDSVYSSIISIFVSGGFIVLSYILVNMLYDIKLLNLPIYVLNSIINDKNIAKGFIFSLIDCTSGLKIITTSNNILSIAFSASTISFGGLSIILQCYAILKSAKIKPTKFFVGKIIQSIFSFIYAIIISLFII